MARPLRLEFTGALNHVASGGDRQDDIYESDSAILVCLSLEWHLKVLWYLEI